MIALLLSAALAADTVPAQVDLVVEPAPTGPDRSVVPSVIEPSLLAHGEPVVHELAPGVVVWHVPAEGMRKVSIEVMFRRGLVELLGNATQPGRAMGWLADVAAGELAGPELSTLSDVYDISVSSGIGLHDGHVSLVVPREELVRGADLASQVLHAPRFEKRDIQRWVTDQHLFYTVDGPSSQGTVANSAMSFSWFPGTHPYGRRPVLTELDGIKSKELAALWSTWTHGVPMTIVVVGDVAWADLEGPLRTMTSELGAAGAPADPLPVTSPTVSRVIAVDMPGQEQVAVRLRAAAPPQDHPEHAAFTATNWILGGHFLSRLNRNLREEKGFTYGSRSDYRSSPTWGSLTVSVDVKVENLAATIHEIEVELQRLVDEPVTDDEIAAARRSLASDWNRTFETSDRALGLYVQAVDQRETLNQSRTAFEAVGATTGAEAQRVATAWLSTEQPRVWVLVGDRAAMEPQLTEAGLSAEWIDPATAILGKF